MRFSTTIATALMAGLAAASPIELEERAMFTVYHTVMVTDYAYAQKTVTGATITRTVQGQGGHQDKTVVAQPVTSTTTCTSDYVAPTSTSVPTYSAPSAEDEYSGGSDSEKEPTYVYYTTYYAETTTEAAYEAPTTTTAEQTYVAPTTTKAATTTAATTSSAASAAPSTGNSMADECLASHNKYRALHGAPNLVWNDTMATYAKGVSGTCVFEHSGGPYGENLAAGYDTPSDAIDAWYAEEKDYSYTNPGFGEDTGHFTQLVWRSAQQVGCAVYTCDGTGNTPGVFLTCEYDTGNVIGRFPENVFPLGTAIQKGTDLVDW